MNKTLFLDRKTGSKNGRDYEIVEFSKNHRNFTVNLDENLDRNIFKTLKNGDVVVLTTTVEAGYDGRGRAIVVDIKKVA
jgi:hypothetical protein